LEFEFMIVLLIMINVWQCQLILDNESGAVGERKFCLPEYGVKFKTKCGVIFCFEHIKYYIAP